MMKISRFVIFIIMILKINMLFGQQEEIKLILIKYVDFSILTDSRVNCKDFESAFSYKEIEIKDKFIFKTFSKFLNEFRKDTINNNSPDTRAKIIISYKCKKEDVICVSNYGICLNSIAITYNKEYLDYLKRLIREKDKNFNF